MPITTKGAVHVRRLVRPFRRDWSDATEGFSLVEVMVALSLLAIVMSAAGLLFAGTLKTSSIQDQRQEAVMLADQGLELARAVPISTLLDGRTQTAIHNQWTTQAGIINLTQSAEPTAGATAPAPTVPYQRPMTIAGVTYTINTIIGSCNLAAGGTSCTPTNTGAPMYRIAVGVTWTPGRGQRCPTTGSYCEITADTLLNRSSDPTFNISG